MKNIILILFIIPIIASAQFIQNNSRSLFSDVKAFKVDDAVMIYILEDTQADNSAGTQADRNSDIGAGFGFNAGTSGTAVDGGIGTSNDFQGRGETSRQERIRSKVSARVVEVEPNGNLKIEGTRTTKINGETQTITINGVVRPVDIRPDNSVLSYHVLDLSLTIDGDGSVTEVQEPGLITKFLRLLF